MRNWKTLADDGGGVLGNFISHCFHYLEWFCGPMARVFRAAFRTAGDDDLQTTVADGAEFARARSARSR